MTAHLTGEKLAELRRGATTAEETLALTRHLATCRDCTALAQRPVAARALADALRDELDEHPDVETELSAYADGSLDGDGRARIDAHVADCERCRTDLADLQDCRPEQERGVIDRRWLAAAATVLVAVLGGVWLSTRPPDVPPRITSTRPRPPQARPLPPAWAALVATAVSSGRVAMPALLREVRADAESFRGTPEGGALPRLEPVGVIVESDRPLFRWPAGSDSVVTVYANDRKLAESPPLRSNRWQPTRPLPRGVALTWQVRSRSGDVLPAPPAPPALFAIASEADLRDLAAARAQHPGNHLLLGVLYARAGMRDEAIRELRQNPQGRAIVESIEAWR